MYDIGIRLYYGFAWLISPWNRKAKLWVKGRRGWQARFFSRQTGWSGSIALHWVSLNRDGLLLKHSGNDVPAIRSCLHFSPLRVLKSGKITRGQTT